jgi:hypothetical protein
MALGLLAVIVVSSVLLIWTMVLYARFRRLFWTIHPLEERARGTGWSANPFEVMFWRYKQTETMLLRKDIDPRVRRAWESYVTMLFITIVVAFGLVAAWAFLIRYLRA